MRWNGPGRRALLKGLAALLALPAGLAAGRPAPAATPAAALPGAGPGADAGAGFRLVNGWILSERDVAALARSAAGRAA